MKSIANIVIIILIVLFVVTSCNRNEMKKEEQLTIAEYQQQNERTGIPTNKDSIQSQFVSSCNSVLLTGINRVRLIPIYKINPQKDRNIEYDEGTTYSHSYYDDNYEEEGSYKYYMPGIDIIYGYNLINVGHYDLENGTLSYFFENPVLIKTLYFPGLKNDSLNHIPVHRDYFMVSVYDQDTNQDSVINKKDLRKFYHIDQLNSKKTQLIPDGYSAIRSTYDYKNDIMYIYAKYDENHNGTPDKRDPIAIFWIRLSDPTVVRRMI